MGNKTSKPLSRKSRPLGSTGTIDEDDVQNLPYFYSELSRHQAEDIMRRHAKDPGSFLLRFSSEHDRYAITVVAARNLIGHTIIFSQHNRTYYAVKDVQFESMPALIDYYTSHPLPNVKDTSVEAKLKTPIYRFRKPISNPGEEPSITQQQAYWRGSAVYESIRSREPGSVHFMDFEESVTLPHPPHPPITLSSQSRFQHPRAVDERGYLTPDNYAFPYVIADDVPRECHPRSASDDITRVKEVLRSEVRLFSFKGTEPSQVGENNSSFPFIETNNLNNFSRSPIKELRRRPLGMSRESSCSDLYTTMRSFQH